ncbi:MAG: hypothetical protein ABJ327_18805 [Litoreibacter sp.]
MVKRLLLSALGVVGALLSGVIADDLLGSRSPLGGNISRDLSRIVTGSPQDFAVDVDVALQIFDDTCMTATVFKTAPYTANDLFLEAGLEETVERNFVQPGRPLNAHAFNRPEGEGFECFVTFVSFENIVEYIKPAFETFTATRLNRPMEDNPDAFKFAYPEQPEDIQSDRPEAPDPAVIKSFADTDDIFYFVILRTDSYSLNHVLQLVVLPLSEIEADQ